MRKAQAFTPNFLVTKFFVNGQRFAQKSAETFCRRKIFSQVNQVEKLLFYAVIWRYKQSCGTVYNAIDWVLKVNIWLDMMYK